MADRFSGRRVIVTGGASGIGAAAARAFAAEGAAVLIADIQEKGEAVAASLRAQGAAALFCRSDVTVASECAAMVQRAIDELGGLDVAFNNAAVVGAGALAADETEDSWNRIIDINLNSVYLSMKFEIAAMLRQGSGVIVNNASVAALLGWPAAASYSASKHGILGLTRSAALDYIGKGIRINALCPGAIKTEMLVHWLDDPDTEAAVIAGHPIGRLGTAQEVAACALFLASDDAAFMVGHALVVDGGFSIR